MKDLKDSYFILGIIASVIFALAFLLSALFALINTIPLVFWASFLGLCLGILLLVFHKRRKISKIIFIIIIFFIILVGILYPKIYLSSPSCSICEFKKCGCVGFLSFADYQGAIFCEGINYNCETNTNGTLQDLIYNGEREQHVFYNEEKMKYVFPKKLVF